jgi:hypothetical protein
MQTLESLLEIASLSPPPQPHDLSRWVCDAIRTLPYASAVGEEKEMTSFGRMLNMGDTFLQLMDIYPAVPTKIVDKTCVQVPVDANYVVRYKRLQTGDDGRIEVDDTLIEAVVAYIRWKYYSARTAVDPNKYGQLAQLYKKEFDEESYNLRQGVMPSQLKEIRQNNTYRPQWTR